MQAEEQAAKTESPTAATAVSREEIKAYIDDREQKVKDRLEEQIGTLYDKIRSLENNLNYVEKSRIAEEKVTLNTIAKHINKMEGDIKEQMTRVDEFFAQRAHIEQRKGKLGILEEQERLLRESHMIFSKVTTELHNSRMQWNILTERLRITDSD